MKTVSKFTIGVRVTVIVGLL